MLVLLLLLARPATPAPLRLPAHVMLQPLPAMPLNLQQMLDLQRFQLNALPTVNEPQPLVILLPNDELKSNQLEQNDIKTKSDFGKVDEDLDSVVLDAPSDVTPSKALILLPNGRFSIGDFISSIPWLPIEVNVPDTISWAYNGIASGIAGIISIIGQRFPFQRPQTAQEPSPATLKSIVNSLRIRNNFAKPIMIMPHEAQALNLPIQV